MVFGDGIGSVVSPQEQSGNKGDVILHSHTESKHWNSGQTAKSLIKCVLDTSCIVKQIVLSIRCAKFVTIKGGSSEDDDSVLLLSRTETGVNDNATYNGNLCEKTYDIYDPSIINVVTIELETGGNISLFWVKVFGQPRHIKK